MTLQEKINTSNLAIQGKENKYIEDIRTEGLKTFQEKGFPTIKDEEWRYTNLRPVLSNDLEANDGTTQELSLEDIKPFLIEGLDSYKLIFVDEVFNAELSQTNKNDKYTVLPLSTVLKDENYQEIIQKNYAQIAPKDLALVGLNNAVAKEGAFVEVKNKTIVEKPIEILFLSTKQDKMNHTRNLILVGSSSEVSIIESHHNLSKGKNLTISVSEMNVKANSHVDYAKIQNDTLESSILDNTYTTQEADTVCSVNTFSFGGQLTRNNLEFVQQGSNSDSILNSITVIAGNQLVDNHTLVEHKATHCESNETYKGIYLDKSRGVFNGKVYVHKEAQKLNAYQQNDTILLSEGAEIDSKPQLEIFADDVRCTHGCTIGQLDADAVFYLQSRGIPKKEAEALLTYAFANDALKGVKLEALKTKINRLIADKLNVKVDFSL